jgi:hypothetical protein
VLNLDVHGERFGHKLDFTAQPLDQHSGVPLHLFRPVIDARVDLFELPIDRLETPVVPDQLLSDRFETPIVPVQSLLDRLEAPVNPFESPVYLRESLVNLLESAIQAACEPIKAFIKILHQFLVHAASADG